MLDTGDQKFMVGMGVWEIIKDHYTWIYEQGVNMGGSEKSGFRFKLVYTRGVAKTCLGRKRY